MNIDRTTLADLEVFGSSDGGAGVLDLIDRTTTAYGRAALRRRLERPSADIAAIRGVQQIVTFLRDQPPPVQIGESLMAPVAQYLRSNIVVEQRSAVPGPIEHLWLRLRYRDLVQEIAAGVDATVYLFREVRRLCAALDAAGAPAGLAGLVARLAATSDAVLAARDATRDPLGCDPLFRATHRSALEDALQLVGELDALRSMAEATRALGWTMPELVESNAFVLEAEGVRHPFISDAVENPVRLTGGEPMVFLTGPNMAGKTTYLRSVAIVVLLAHAGMGVPARRVRLSPVEALFTSLNPSDNLRAGLSYFFAEVLRVKAAAALLAEGRRALVIFDEVFKGTNVRDALDASAEVILGFARARRSGFIFSSHLSELVGVLRTNPAIRFCCFNGEIEHGVPRYSYALEEGVSDKRFGLLLLRQAEVPQLLARIGA